MTLIGNPFTYLAYDLTTMTQLDSLPYTQCGFGQTINQPGGWAGSLPLADSRVQAMDWRNATRTGRTALFVDLDDALVWGGVIWTRRYQESSKVLQVGASEFGSYPQKRLQALDYTNTWAAATDPMTIAKQIATDAQAVSGGSIAGGFTFTVNPASGSGPGAAVAVSYPKTQLQTVDSIVNNLSQMGYTLGFDYSFDVAYTAGPGSTPGVTMNFWYPRKGRTADQTNLVVMNKDTIDFSYDEDSTQQANSIIETGSGTGGLQPVAATAFGSTVGYPLLEAAIDHSDINDIAVLSNASLGDLGLMCYPVTTPSITFAVPLPDSSGVIGPAHLAFGQWTVGDDFIFDIDPVGGSGENQSPRFPNGMSFEWRINSWACAVKEQGVSTVVWQLGVPPINVIPPPQPPL